MLDEVLVSGNGEKEDCKLRDTLKIIADKSICHYENFYREGSHSWGLIYLLKKILMDKNERVNLDVLMKCIINILHAGVEIQNLVIHVCRRCSGWLDLEIMQDRASQQFYMHGKRKDGIRIV